METATACALRTTRTRHALPIRTRWSYRPGFSQDRLSAKTTLLLIFQHFTRQHSPASALGSCNWALRQAEALVYIIIFGCGTDFPHSTQITDFMASPAGRLGEGLTRPRQAQLAPRAWWDCHASTGSGPAPSLIGAVRTRLATSMVSVYRGKPRNSSSIAAPQMRPGRQGR